MPNGKPISYEHFRRTFYKDIKAAGVRKIRFHDLRATFASQWAMSGGNIHALSKVLGHSSLDITIKRYATLSPSYLNSVSESVSFEADSTFFVHQNVVELKKV